MVPLSTVRLSCPPAVLRSTNVDGTYTSVRQPALVEGLPIGAVALGCGSGAAFACPGLSWRCMGTSPCARVWVVGEKPRGHRGRARDGVPAKPQNLLAQAKHATATKPLLW